MAVSGLGHRLAAVRNMARLSQEETSQALGISRSAYQNYERGQRNLTAQLLLEVYEKFDVDPLWMLEGDHCLRSLLTPAIVRKRRFITIMMFVVAATGQHPRLKLEATMSV